MTRSARPELPGVPDAPWGTFWRRLLSPPTARFILALLVLLATSGAMFWLMSEGIEPEAEDTIIFGLGMLFGLAKDAFGYYFGSTARGDERPVETEIVNTTRNPVPVEEESTR
jgi:hypothetical protein